MLSAIAAMTVVLAIIVGLVLVVTIGIADRWSHLTSARFTAHMRNIAKHLNGDAEPPQVLLRLFDARR